MSIKKPSPQEKLRPSEPGTIRFFCPHCHQKLAADSDMEGDEIQCPSCNNPIEVVSKTYAPALFKGAFSESGGDKKKTLALYTRNRDELRQQRKETEEAAEEKQKEEARQRAKKAAVRPTEKQRKEDVQRWLRLKKQQNAGGEGAERKLPVKTGALSCPQCGATYTPADYRADTPTWLCSNCKATLPKT